MAETLKQALDAGGPFAVWRLLDEDEQREASAALWENADRESREALEMALAKEMKFRPQSVRRLSADQVAPRLARMADTLPEPVLFQYLFHLHMEARRELLKEFLDAVELPHDEGVLDLPEEVTEPEAGKVVPAAESLVERHGRSGLVYLATLKVADAEFWQALDPVLEAYDAEGEKV